MVEKEYARALYDLAQEENKLDLFSQSFVTVIETLKDKDFYNVITSPVIDVNEKKKIIGNVYKSLDLTFVNFLYVVIDHNRASILEAIYQEYSNLVLEVKNIIKIEIISAKELTKKQLEQLTNTLEVKYQGKKLEIENIINSELIGGIKIISNGESLDISLKSTIEKMKESL